ncbi:glycosyl hydrolases family 18-domain-containing protein [Blakeslea trispora]|nr:glycosyl hydrolases family 18-domain-containing protein [Blakeslea trispora]
MKSSIVVLTLYAIALCECSTKVVIGYFPNWLSTDYPVESIPYQNYTHINYAFAVLNNQDHLPSISDQEVSALPQLIQLAHGNHTKVSLSVGGWTGSKRFSSMVSSSASRKKFIRWNLDFIKKYDTDGIDLDWEYPAKQGAGCNEFSDHDTDNYLLLLRELRTALDAQFPNQHKEISMAVYVEPFLKSGAPMTNLSAFVPYFDYVNLMTYDMNGPWGTTTAPNAPFEAMDGQGAPFSFVKSIQNWKAAGIPANMITAGLAFYGRSMTAKIDMTQDPLNQFQPSEKTVPQGDTEDTVWSDPYCDKEPPSYSGIWKWASIRQQGLLKDDLITADKGWYRQWDNATKTPWLFNPSTKQYISYDDPSSLQIKIQHAVCEDLAGVMVWDIHQDNGELLEVIDKIHAISCPTSGNQMATTKPDEFNLSQSSSVKLSSKSTQFSSTSTRSITRSASPTPSAQNKNEKCSNSGAMKCKQPGKSSQWLTCDLGHWVTRNCAHGLICYDGPDGPVCNYPQPLRKVDIASASSQYSVSSESYSSVASMHS